MTISKPITPVIEAISKLLITGNITPHVWYLRSEFRTDSNRPDRNMITAVADILYWYRPKEVRDEEQGGIFVGYERKFARDMLQYDYGRRAAIFGMSEREMREACTKAAKRGLLRIEYRTERFKGKLLHNVVYIEPVAEAIAATLVGPNLGPVEKAKGATRGRHAKVAEVTEVLDPNAGVDETLPDDPPLPADPPTDQRERSQNFGRLPAEGENPTSQNSGKVTSQNLEEPGSKFWDTYHESSHETSLSRKFSGGEAGMDEIGSPPEASPAPQQSTDSAVPYTTTTEAAPKPAHGEGPEPQPQRQTPQPSPDGAGAEAPRGVLTDTDLDELFNPENVDVKAPEQVPGAAGLAGLAGLTPVGRAALLKRPPVGTDSPEYRQIQAMVTKKLLKEGLLAQPTPTGGYDRHDWMRLSLDELNSAKAAAQIEAQQTGGSFVTLVIRALDALIGSGRSGASEGEQPRTAAQHDPKLTTGQRCTLGGQLGVVFQVGAPAYIIDLDDGERVTVDRALRASLQQLKPSDVPCGTRPEGAAPLGAEGSRWLPKGGGEVVTVTAASGAQRTLSDGRQVPVYTLTSKFQPAT